MCKVHKGLEQLSSPKEEEALHRLKKEGGGDGGKEGGGRKYTHEMQTATTQASNAHIS